MGRSWQGRDMEQDKGMDNIGAPLGTTTTTSADKLHLLVSEFRFLTEPIDRVKRLLSYATALAPLEDSARVPANRVTGCTTQVWLEIKKDELGRMRFKADSDSEISKGFCSCLIWTSTVLNRRK
ncbi:hypothetical protein F2Q70_00045064 [Brassica cretica]|uniref:Fe-S metabolism associated domain-containing protein n=1 Tax=Brassica cretica TaxID=69181 RepID=A0A8S9KDA2_BRACR|nr:hypothetical protein F2Q70_00045064 [Brassica cretica]